MSDGTVGGGNPSAGWYPDPQVAGQQRWWDGTAWSEHTAPIAPSTPATPATPGTPGAWNPSGYSAPGGATGGVAIDTYLWQSILATVLCCMPLGIPAIVFSSQAQSAINMGNLAEATQKAGQAKTFTLISVILGFLPWAFGLLWIFGMGTMFWGL